MLTWNSLKTEDTRLRRKLLYVKEDLSLVKEKFIKAVGPWQKENTVD